MKIKSLLLFIVIGLSSSTPSFGAYETYESKKMKVCLSIALGAITCGTAAWLHANSVHKTYQELKKLNNRTPEQQALLVTLEKQSSRLKLMQYGCTALGAMWCAFGVYKIFQCSNSNEVWREAQVKKVYDQLQLEADLCTPEFDDQLATACSNTAATYDNHPVFPVMKPQLDFFARWMGELGSGVNGGVLTNELPVSGYHNTAIASHPRTPDSAADREFVAMCSAKIRSPKLQAIFAREAKIYDNLQTRARTVHSMLHGKRALATVGLRLPPSDGTGNPVDAILGAPRIAAISRCMRLIEMAAARLEDRYQLVTDQPMQNPIEHTSNATGGVTSGEPAAAAAAVQQPAELAPIPGGEA